PNRSGPLSRFWDAAPPCRKASNGRWGSNSRAIPENPAVGWAKSLVVAKKNCAELAGVFARAAALLFGDRQRLGVVGEGIEIGDCVSALAAPGQAGEIHFGTGNEFFRICQEFIQIVDRPLPTLCFHGVGIAEPWLHGFGPADDAIKIWP